ncbi:hypothetical protein SAMN06265365_1488 [Tistlia consotensis]|uniref:Uncharacterized protein n=2 Tax=Tistlia TaxID=1321364 RepID=A0A1Y6CQ63_9PROT|nr:hypothetical protein [Tistlia consotensis]SMF82848.1 hypothetical protein SAMN05428998_1489 [Tistlia consotensis USBA 355]SNS31099.1 hypothetical protein SAMN06265365_1488 [Tistlia consotensis]
MLVSKERLFEMAFEIVADRSSRARFDQPGSGDRLLKEDLVKTFRALEQATAELGGEVPAQD